MDSESLHEKIMLNEISPSQLQRYIEMRHKINQDQKTIYAISSILAVFSHLDEDRILIDADALGHINQLVNKAVLNIWETLDDFIPILSAELALDKVNGLSRS